MESFSTQNRYRKQGEEHTHKIIVKGWDFQKAQASLLLHLSLSPVAGVIVSVCTRGFLEHVIIKSRSVSETYVRGHSNVWHLFADSSFVKSEIVSGLKGVGGVALTLIVTIQW